MRKGLALLEVLVYIVVAAAALAVLVPLWADFHAAGWATSQAIEDLDAAGVFLAAFKADVRRARELRVDEDVVQLDFDDGGSLLYRFGGPEGGVRRQEGEELRSWGGAIGELRFSREGRRVRADLELRRHPGGALRPRLRAEVFARNAELVR